MRSPFARKFLENHRFAVFTILSHEHAVMTTAEDRWLTPAVALAVVRVHAHSYMYMAAKHQQQQRVQEEYVQQSSARRQSAQHAPRTTLPSISESSAYKNNMCSRAVHVGNSSCMQPCTTLPSISESSVYKNNMCSRAVHVGNQLMHAQAPARAVCTEPRC